MGRLAQGAKSSGDPSTSERPSVDAVHELRTPLTRMRGELELILRSGVGDPLRSQLESVHEDLEQLSRLCGALLLLARLEAQPGALGDLDDPIELDEVLSELLELMAPFARDRGVSLRRAATKASRVRGNRRLLAEALLNLLDAAIRGANEGDVVSIAIDEDGGFTRLAVADAGEVRMDERCELSLALARGIARLHGGRLELDEAPDGLGIFRLVLPTYPAP